MSLVTEEINEAIKSLSINEGEFKKLPDSEAKALFSELLEIFVEGGDRKWWWESFKLETKSINYKDNKGYERIPSFIPSPDEKVFFVAEEDQLPFYPIYEGTPKAIVEIIGQCYAFEYYIVPKSKDWLLCENHHNNLIGCGEIIVNQMSKSA